MYKPKKNHRLRDLLLSAEDMRLLNECANKLGLKNSDLARMLIRKSLLDLKNADELQLAIVGREAKK